MIMYVEVTIINSIAAIEPSDLMTDKKKSCILLFLPGSSLCEESQLRLLCLLWKKLPCVKQKDSCQRTPGPCACVCEWARRPLL